MGLSGLDLREWRLKRARRAIEEYVRGVRKRAAIGWVLGVLKGSNAGQMYGAPRTSQVFKLDMEGVAVSPHAEGEL